jgi:xanthine/CO dehydrogenase XdhC/CoxF family maturation factor
MAVSADGRFAGSVSGGCVETAVIEEALAVLSSGEPRLLRYGITDEMAWDVGLACGGTIEVFVEPVEQPSPPSPLSQSWERGSRPR